MLNKMIVMMLVPILILGGVSCARPATGGEPISTMSGEQPDLEEIEPPKKPLTAEEWEKKESDAIEKYNALLKFWAWDERYISDTDADFPEFYGGAYLNGDKDLVIHVTKLDQETRDYFGGIIDLDGIVFEQVKYSFTELINEQKAIISRWTKGRDDDELLKSITGVGLAMQENAVNLYISDAGISSEERDAFAQKVREAVTSFENINIIFSQGVTAT